MHMQQQILINTCHHVTNHQSVTSSLIVISRVMLSLEGEQSDVVGFKRTAISKMAVVNKEHATNHLQQLVATAINAAPQLVGGVLQGSVLTPLATKGSAAREDLFINISKFRCLR